MPFHERGKLTDEYLEAIIELWTSDTPEYHGQYVDFADVAFEPKPLQQPHPPVWVGGDLTAAMRRAARHDGWYPWLITADEIPECLDYVREQPGFAERTQPFDVALPLTTLAVDEEHRPLDGDLGRAHVPRERRRRSTRSDTWLEVGVTCTSVPTPMTARSTNTSTTCVGSPRRSSPRSRRTDARLDRRHLGAVRST